MRAMYKAVLLIGLTATIPAGIAAQDRDDRSGQTIIVTGTPSPDYRADLEACVARGCSTPEDIAATLMLAESEYLNGDYREARRTVRASLRRNRNRAAQHPEPLASLHRADARLSWTLGLDTDGRQATFAVLSSLRAGIPEEDHRHFTARFEIAEMYFRAHEFIQARRMLAQIAELAAARNRPDIAAMAELRSLWFDYRVDARPVTRDRIASLAQTTDPSHRIRTTGAKMLLSRIYRLEGDTARADALLRDVGATAGGGRRMLLYSPTYQLGVRDYTGGNGFGTDSGPSAPVLTAASLDYNDVASRYTTLNRMSDNFEDKWIDVGFWVAPDGRVTQLDVVREGGAHDWAQPLLQSIRGRLYSPAADASYRLERYTYTSDYETPTGSRFAVRTRRARVEYLDLTEQPAAPN